MTTSNPTTRIALDRWSLLLLEGDVENLIGGLDPQNDSDNYKHWKRIADRVDAALARLERP